MKFKPENTAISRKKISSPLGYLLERKYFLSKKHHTVFDYGCGKGKDFSWLKKEGYKVVAWDPYWKPDNKPGSNEQFDVVLCTYVLNVISTPEGRKEIINDTWNYVAPGGFLLLSTRTSMEISSCSRNGSWTPFNDGFVSSDNLQTFQKGFEDTELYELFCATVDGIGYTEISNKSSDFAFILAGRKTIDDRK